MNTHELNYFCGRHSDQYTPDNISALNFPFGSGVNFLMAAAICQRYRFCTMQFEKLCGLHGRVNQSIDEPSGNHGPVAEALPPVSLTGEPTLLYEYSFVAESLIFQIRRTLDTFVQLTETIAIGGEDRAPQKLAAGGIASLLKSGGEKRASYPIIMGDDDLYRRDPTEYAHALNDLFNAMKHHALHEESHSFWARDVPAITSFYVKNNDPDNGVLFLNHSAHQLMMGYQDWVARLITNLERFQSP